MRTKHPDLDDIGHIGDGRSLTDEESQLVSAHIQAYKAKHTAPKRKPIARGATDKMMHQAVKARAKKTKGPDAGLRALDDIGHIGGDLPYTEEDAGAVSAFIQAEKSKRATPRKTVAKRTGKRSVVKGRSKTKTGA